MPEVNNLLELIQKSSNILILINGVKDKLESSRLQLLVNLLVSQNKKYEIVNVNSKDTDSGVVNDLFQKNIEIGDELKPQEYVISIDYGSSQVEKVVYDTDKEQGKLIFKILPSKSGFSFDKVEFTEGGSKFDGIICIGIENPKNLTQIYDKHEQLFRDNSYFLFNNFQEILSVLSRGGGRLDDEIYNQLLDSMLLEINLIEGYPDASKTQELITLAQNGGDLSKSIFAKYYSKPSSYIQLLKLLFENLKIQEEKRILYSVVKEDDLKMLAIDISEIETMGRIPFNISKDFDLAFAFFELEKEKIVVLIESNNIDKFSAHTIAGIYNGYGDRGHAVCTLDFGLKDIDKRFLIVLKDLYNIDISLLNKVPVVDNYKGRLTKGRKYSKNKGLIK